MRLPDKPVSTQTPKEVAMVKAYARKRKPLTLPIKRKIRKESSRTRRRNAEYAILRQQMLVLYPVCQRCGKRPSVDIHHLISRNLSPKDVLNMDLMKCICRQCHHWIHDHPASAYMTGWLHRAPP